MGCQKHEQTTQTSKRRWITCLSTNKSIWQSSLWPGTEELQLLQFTVQRVIDFLHDTHVLHQHSTKPPVKYSASTTVKYVCFNR